MILVSEEFISNNTKIKTNEFPLLGKNEISKSVKTNKQLENQNYSSILIYTNNRNTP